MRFVFGTLFFLIATSLSAHTPGKHYSQAYWDTMCDYYGGHYCDHADPGGQTLRQEAFTESGSDCNYFVAYQEAQLDINYLCYTLRSGQIISNPTYRLLNWRRITTGSCPDPNGGNGLGTLHLLQLQSRCQWYE